MGVTNADTFATGISATALGGTTTVIQPFAARHQGKSLDRVAKNFHALAARGAVIDYAAQMIIA